MEVPLSKFMAGQPVSNPSYPVEVRASPARHSTFAYAVGPPEGPWTPRMGL